MIKCNTLSKNIVWFTLLFFLCLIQGVVSGQHLEFAESVSFQKKIDGISQTSKVMALKGESLLSLDGGHIQGIQLGNLNDRTQVLLSGSSKDVAVLFIGEVEENCLQINEVDTLMSDPFRHVGGFQWHKHFVAVGIEDNYERDRSMVLIYDLDKKEPWREPNFTLYRKGEKERVTAGAVGMTELEGRVLLAVANWDAKNVDFYVCDSTDFYKGNLGFSLLGTISPRDDHKDWLPYQNINLFSENNRLYMIGLAREGDDRHLADLFLVKFGDGKSITLPFETKHLVRDGEPVPLLEKEGVNLSLEKLSRRSFSAREGADFKAGAGIVYLNGKIGLIAAPYQINEGNSVNIFREFDEWESQERVTLPFSSRWELVDSIPAPEARQAAVATDHHFFAIDNTLLGKYDRSTGALIKQINAKGTKHLNSGYLYGEKILLAHSNYPAAVDSSDIRILDPKTMEMKVFKDFGSSEGSLTWVLEKDGFWYCLFAYYRDENEKTYLAKFDADWKEVDRWSFPSEVLEKIGHMSISGGVFWKSGFLVTSHDDRELHYVKIPTSGVTLQYIATFPAPFWGQGIASDPKSGDIIGIDRPSQQLLIGRFDP